MKKILGSCPPHAISCFDLKPVAILCSLAFMFSDSVNAEQIEWVLQKGTSEVLTANNETDNILNVKDKPWIVISTTPYTGGNYIPSTDIEMNVNNYGQINIQNSDLIGFGEKFINFKTKKNINIRNEGSIFLENSAIQFENKTFNNQHFINSGIVEAQFLSDSRSGVLYHSCFSERSVFNNQKSIAISSESNEWFSGAFTFRGFQSSNSTTPATFLIENTGNITLSGNYTQVFRIEASSGSLIGDIKNIGWIDKKGFSEHDYTPGYERTMKYDYRKFDIKGDNILLKGNVSDIKNGYEITE